MLYSLEPVRTACMLYSLHHECEALVQAQILRHKGIALFRAQCNILRTMKQKAPVSSAMAVWGGTLSWT